MFYIIFQNLHYIYYLYVAINAQNAVKAAENKLGSQKLGFIYLTYLFTNILDKNTQLIFITIFVLSYLITILQYFQ